MWQRRTSQEWERLASSRQGTVLMFVWAVTEATVWPIIPDFLLVPLLAGRRCRPVTLLLAAIAGMALGGAAGYLFAYGRPPVARAALRKLPLLRPGDVEVVAERLQRSGVVAFLGQPYSGVPMKVWAVAGATPGIPPRRAIPVFVAGRALRMAMVAALTRLLLHRLRATVRHHFLLLAILYVTLFFGIWGRMLRRR